MPDFVTYEIRGTNRVKNQLRFLMAMYPSEVDPVIKQHAKQEASQLRKTPYPSYLPHFTHTRKKFFGGIAGSFGMIQKKVGVYGVKNSQKHSPFVIGRPFQKRQHPSFLRWWVMADEVQSRMPLLTMKLTEFAEKKLNSQ